MTDTNEIWKILDQFLDVINNETGFPVLIYDTNGIIVKATDSSRIGTLHSGALKIMRGELEECAITGVEAASNPLVKEGYSCPIFDGDTIFAGFGITGELHLAKPVAKIAAKIIQAWIAELKIQKRLELSEKKYKAIFDDSMHGIFQASLEGTFLTANKALASLLGHSSEESLLKTIDDIGKQIYVDPTDRQKFLDELIREKHLSGFRTKLKRKDGEVIDVKIHARIVENEDGLIFLEGQIEDISAQLKAEKAIRFSEEKYAKAFNNSPVWVVISSLEDGRYIEVNECFLQKMGFSHDEVLGETSQTLQTWENPEDREPIVRELRTHGRISEHEVRRRTKHGEILTMLYWAERITIGGEKCMVSVSLDITQKKLAEAETARLESALLQAQKMEAIGTMAGGIAHDFNNMLGGIMGGAEMLKFYLPDDPQARRYHNMIMEAVKRAAGLTDKLLTFARSNPKTSSAVDLHDLLNDTILLFSNTVDKRITVKRHLLAQTSTVVGDPSQLQNAFLNLCINSAQAMPYGGVIDICSRLLELDDMFCQNSAFDLDPGEYIEIEVRDNGIGMNTELQKKVFEPFFTTKGPGKGTGLGLSSTYGTVQQHRGAISVNSEPGIGTSFHLYLPIVRSDINVSEHLDILQRGSGHILVVDDEEVMRVTAQAILEELGYSVTLAENGMEALDRVQQEKESFDLVLLDMVMPVMNGKDCFAALKKINPDIRVLLTSGFTRIEDLEEMNLSELKGFIRKPYRSTELSQAVHKALS